MSPSSQESCQSTGYNTSSYSSSFLPIWFGCGVSFVITHTQAQHAHTHTHISHANAGPKTLEPFKEWAWAVFAGIIFGIHHLYILQPIALVSG